MGDTRWHRNRLALWWVVIMGVVMLAGIFKGDTPGPGDDIEMSLNRSAANHSNGMIQLWGRPSRRRRPTFAPIRRRRPTFVPTRRRQPQRYHRRRRQKAGHVTTTGSTRQQRPTERVTILKRR